MNNKSLSSAGDVGQKEPVRVVFFGSIGVAAKILEELLLPERRLQIVGILCEKDISSWRTERSVYDVLCDAGLPLLTFERLLDMDVDLGISVRYNRIIRPEVIARFRCGIVNTHGGILPEYRGSYCNINAILNGEKEYGVTLHYISEGVDTGDIVDTLTVPVKEEDTGFSLYRASERLCYAIVQKNLEDLLRNRNRRVPQAALVQAGRNARTYRSAETLALKRVTEAEIMSGFALRKVRAFDSDVHEPAYMELEGRRVYLRLNYA